MLGAIYRVVFHPLRNYPGPFLAKVSDFYSGFFALKMSLHLATYTDLKTYGVSQPGLAVSKFNAHDIQVL
jgi:hypothetical protein